MKTKNLLSGLALLGLISLMGCEPPEAANTETGGTNTETVGGAFEVAKPDSFDGDFNPEGLEIGAEVGKLAPEIEGKDLDGIPFKLSDYRGKVVMLDFYGDW